MSINQFSFPCAAKPLTHHAVRASVLALCVIGSAFSASAAMAANAASDANARYQEERAVCMSGRSNQDRTTCLKEAGAALKEAKMGRFNGAEAALDKNALIRCDALPAADRDACQRRMAGEGTTSGSVQEGGVAREIIVPDKK
jgi:hypothetical protein